MWHVIVQKPYRCEVPGCQKRYTDPSSLRKHVKNHSKEEQEQYKVCREKLVDQPLLWSEQEIDANLSIMAETDLYQLQFRSQEEALQYRRGETFI